MGRKWREGKKREAVIEGGASKGKGTQRTGWGRSPIWYEAISVEIKVGTNFFM